MRGLLPVAAAVLTVVLVAGCGSSLEEDQQGSTGGPVKVGLLMPKAGVYAPLGRDMENGFRLYLDAHGGKLGGRDLVTDGKVPLIIANAITGEQRSDHVWCTSFTNGEVAGALGGYVAGQVKGGTVFLAAPDYAAGKEATAGFQEAFEAAGGRVAGTELTPFGTTTNFQPYLARTQRSGARAVYCFYAGAEAVAFVKQYQQFGLAGRIPLYCSGFVTEGGVLPSSRASRASARSTAPAGAGASPTATGPTRSTTCAPPRSGAARSSTPSCGPLTGS